MIFSVLVRLSEHEFDCGRAIARQTNGSVKAMSLTNMQFIDVVL